MVRAKPTPSLNPSTSPPYPYPPAMQHKSDPHLEDKQRAFQQAACAFRESSTHSVYKLEHVLGLGIELLSTDPDHPEHALELAECMLAVEAVSHLRPWKAGRVSFLSWHGVTTAERKGDSAISRAGISRGAAFSRFHKRSAQEIWDTYRSPDVEASGTVTTLLAWYKGELAFLLRGALRFHSPRGSMWSPHSGALGRTPLEERIDTLAQLLRVIAGKPASESSALRLGRALGLGKESN